MKEIPLTQGKVALVDDRDYEWLTAWKWHADKWGNTWRACRGEYHPIFRLKKISMHRLIVDAPDNMVVDHINGDGLDNRRENLRICSHAENIHNSKIPKNNTSGYKGVVSLKNGRFLATIRYRGERISLGVFNSSNEAAKAYDDAARKYFGKYARTNF